MLQKHLLIFFIIIQTSVTPLPKTTAYSTEMKETFNVTMKVGIEGNFLIRVMVWNLGKKVSSLYKWVDAIGSQELKSVKKIKTRIWVFEMYGVESKCWELRAKWCLLYPSNIYMTRVCFHKIFNQVVKQKWV